MNTALLLEMLTYCRPSDSPSERLFINRYILGLPGVTRDAYGNYHVTIGDSPILWSCHTDTVHRLSGRQTLHYDALTGVVQLSRKSKLRSSCLGADDTAGVFICLEMIKAGIPGHYVFHSAEEIGGVGSSELARYEPALVSSSKFAIALDRRGTRDVITHQMFRCCSDAFATSLADQLNLGGLTYRPSDRGIFTDTANYIDIIGECTNLSVGYSHEHSRDECLDVCHVERLLTALCALDPSKLIDERTPDTLDDWHWRYTTERPTVYIDDRLYKEECKVCSIVYDPWASTAIDTLGYCSRDCEDWDEMRHIREHETMYLDPTYEDVQLALRRVKQ